MTPPTSSDRKSLLSAAEAAAQHAYSPYSGIGVGAAVRTERAVYIGTTVENASYGLTICAEMAALAAAVAAGDRDIKAIAIAPGKASADDAVFDRILCGACRQWILEFGANAEIYVAGIDRVLTIADVLPAAFQFEPNAGVSDV